MAEVDSSERANRKTWQWNHIMTSHLIAKLREYKNEMDYKNVDFNKDVVQMYSQLLERMAQEFPRQFWSC